MKSPIINSTYLSAAPTSLVESAISGFKTHYGLTATHIAIAPARVNIIGDHTDYTQGLAMPMTVNRWTVIVGANGDSPAVWQLESDLFTRTVSINSELVIEPANDTADYARGVIAEYLNWLAKNGHTKPHAQKLYCVSNIPIGAGLSSSAAFSVALATYIEDLCNLDQCPTRRAAISRTAEHKFAGVPCGIMDQYTIINGRKNSALKLDCRSENAELINMCGTEPIRWLVIHSGISHQLSDGNYAARFNECKEVEALLGKSLRDCDNSDVARLKNPTLYKRAKHVVSENKRVIQFAKSLAQNNWHSVGTVMNQSHQSLSQDFQSACSEIDQLVTLAQKAHGVYGARITGGGFGGAIIALIDAKRAESIAETIIRGYKNVTRVDAKFWLVSPVDGARMIQLNHKFDDH